MLMAWFLPRFGSYKTLDPSFLFTSVIFSSYFSTEKSKLEFIVLLIPEFAMATICRFPACPLYLATPASLTTSNLDYEPSGCNCDNKTTYDQSAINTACTQALNLASQGKTIGRDKYPHAYNGSSHVSSFPPLPQTSH
jgi:hypothetical protein